MKVRLLTPARLEFLESVEFYESQAPRLGTDFIEEFEAALEVIASNPRAGSPHMEGTRRVLMHRFPMDVVYVEEADSILVVAVAHQRRKPGYWRGRL